MHRTFEEVGLSIAGVPYGNFTGECEFDQAGHVVRITLEHERLEGPSLTLDIAELVRERINLRRQWGTGFLEEGSPDIMAHRIKYDLFISLSVRLEEVFADDVRDYLEGEAEERKYRA